MSTEANTEERTDETRLSDIDAVWASGDALEDADITWLITVAKQRRAVLDLLSESCREWIGDNRCGKPSEFILWGKLFSADALGPRCYDHAAHHVGASSLSYRQVEQSAIFDLRRIRAALAAGGVL